MDLTVNGNYGDINVVEGTAGEISVMFEPFNYRAHDAENDARDELENNFDWSFEVSGNAAVVTTGRHDATNGLGADVTVFLPPEFDGALTLRNDSDGAINPGDIDVDTAGAATLVDVSTDSLGDCSISAAGTVVNTHAHCDGEIHVSGVSNQVDIDSTGLAGFVSLSLWTVEGPDVGGLITTEDGDIDVTFPDGDFTITAEASADGTVASSLGDSCVEAVGSESAKSYTCGAGGPTYVIAAGQDGGGSVTLSQ
jgi:hypothetical protein